MTTSRALDSTIQASIALLTAINETCQQTIQHTDGAYVLRKDGTKCSGLLRRLSAQLPQCAISAAALDEKRPRRWRAPGSSVAIGCRIDAELVHITRCLRGDRGLDVERLVLLETLPTCLKAASESTKMSRTKKRSVAHTCGHCGLTGRRYVAHGSPRWHRWTLAYLRDVARKGMRLVASQVPVANAAARVATEVDDILVDAFGAWVVVERKSGYTQTSDTKSQQIVVRCRAQGRAGHAPLPLHRRRSRSRSRSQSGSYSSSDTERGAAQDVQLPASECTLHQLQASFGADMLARMIATMHSAPGTPNTHSIPAIRRCVVYVSGRSKIRARDLDPSLECVWVWEDAKIRAVAAEMQSTMGF